MRQRLRTAFALWGAAVVALAGCGRPAARGPGPGTPLVTLGTAARPTLRVACASIDEAPLQEAVEVWDTQRPDIAVTLNAEPSAEAPADVSMCGPEVFRGLLRDGDLLDLTPYVVRDHYDIGDLDWRAVELFKDGDRLYGLPAETGADVLYYNTDLFRANRLGVPTSEWRWEDFLGAARALTRDNDGDGLTDQYGFLCTGGASGQWLPWVWGAGGQVLDESGARCLIDQPAAVEGIAFYTDLVTKERVALPLWDGRDGTGLGEDLFATGRVAMCAGPPEFAARANGFADMHWAIALLPRGPKARATRIAARAYVIFSATARPDDAWELVKFLASPAVESLLARHYMVPPRPTLRLVGPSLTAELAWDVTVFTQAIRDARAEPLVAGRQPVHDLMWEEFDLVLRGQASPPVAATQMRRRVEEALRQERTH